MCGSFAVQSNGYEKDWEYLNKKTAAEFYGCFFISNILFSKVVIFFQIQAYSQLAEIDKRFRPSVCDGCNFSFINRAIPDQMILFGNYYLCAEAYDILCQSPVISAETRKHSCLYT